MNKTALIPGSFDPITRGHVDVIERTAKIFDEVIVAVFDNSEKRTLFTAEQRLEMTRLAVQRFPNVRADLSNGLLAEYAKKHNAVLVKGVRNVTDFDYEYWLAAINRNMDERSKPFLFRQAQRYSTSAQPLCARCSNTAEAVRTL